MAVQPERRCVPLEVEMISLHRAPRPSVRSDRARQQGWIRSRIAVVVRAMTRRSRA